MNPYFSPIAITRHSISYKLFITYFINILAILAPKDPQ